MRSDFSCCGSPFWLEERGGSAGEGDPAAAEKGRLMGENARGGDVGREGPIHGGSAVLDNAADKLMNQVGVGAVTVSYTHLTLPTKA